MILKLNFPPLSLNYCVSHPLLKISIGYTKFNEDGLVLTGKISQNSGLKINHKIALYDIDTTPFCSTRHS
jgi:hypothetical protein